MENATGLRVPFLKPIELPWFSDFLGSLWLSDLAMDLGTANTLIYAKGKGIILNEPSIVAVDNNTGKPLAAGREAKAMYGKTSRSVSCIRPMKDGVIADFEMTTLMIQHMLHGVCRRRSIRKPGIVIGVPSGITQVEKRAVIDSALSCGAGRVMLVEEPMAAALGTGLPVEKPCGNMIVDIGGGTTEVAIISMGGTAYSQSIRVAGDEMDEAIMRHLRREYGIEVGVFEAERIKIVIGSAIAFQKPRRTRIFGRDMLTGIPRQVEVSDDVIRDGLNEPIDAIVSSIMAALEQVGPEISYDIISRGIYVTGGGALLSGLTERLGRETGLAFNLSQDPLSCVVRGVGKVVENLKEFRKLCIA